MHNINDISCFEKVIFKHDFLRGGILIYMLFLVFIESCCAENIADKMVEKKQGDFSGKWKFSEEIELEGGVYVAGQEFNIYQSGNHACGCWRKWGAPTGKEEFYSMAGSVEGIVLNLLVDQGSSDNNSDLSYKSTYPFKPENVLRLKMFPGGISVGGIDNPRYVIENGFPKDTDVNYSRVSFFKRDADFNKAMCQDPDIDWEEFYEKCKNAER